MSVDTQTGFLTKLGQKVAYEANKAVDDPNAREYAEQVKQAEEEKKQEKKEEENKPTDGEGEGESKSMRIANQVWKQFKYVSGLLWQPFIGLMLAMFVANDFITYPAPVRVLFFVFTFLLSYFLLPYAILIAIFYLLKKGYSYYVNDMEKGPKRFIFPTIFALLPISTYQAPSSLGKILLWPFTYPTDTTNKLKLPAIMDQYGLDLYASYPGLSEVQTLPVMASALQKFKTHMEHLNDIPESAEESVHEEDQENTENESKPLIRA